MAQLDFRDGPHEVPDYLADLMATIDVRRLTVEQAIAEANKKTLADEINRRYDRIISDHFKELTR